MNNNNNNFLISQSPLVVANPDYETSVRPPQAEVSIDNANLIIYLINLTMHYFYDLKEKKLKGEIDEDKRYIVGWAERGCVSKFRILNLKHLEKFYNSLNASFSRIIHHYPPTISPWVTYTGPLGESPENLDNAIHSINWDEEYYAIIVSRSACGFRMSILPKTPATTEYELYKPSIGLTKILIRLSDGQVVSQYGDRM